MTKTANTVIWRTHTDLPGSLSPITALIAYRDVEGDFFLDQDIHLWRNGMFLNEVTGLRPGVEFWWLPESELLSLLGDKG